MPEGNAQERFCEAARDATLEQLTARSQKLEERRKRAYTREPDILPMRQRLGKGAKGSSASILSGLGSSGSSGAAASEETAIVAVIWTLPG